MVKLSGAQGDGFGVNLNFEVSEGALQKFEVNYLGGAHKDDFICAFFMAYESLFAGRKLSELGALSLREWESYWRDLNHQVVLTSEWQEASVAYYDFLLDILLAEIWARIWHQAGIKHLGSAEWQTLGWIQQLRWLDESFRKLENTLVVPKGSLELVNFQEGNLYLSLPSTAYFSPKLLTALEKFLSKLGIGIKEIKLVA